MNILDRWRVTRMKRDLAALLAEDALDRSAVRTTDDMMDMMVVRAEQIAIMRLKIAAWEGEVDIDPNDPDDTTRQG